MSTVLPHRALAASRFVCRCVLSGALALSFTACGSGSSSGDHDAAPPAPATFSIGGSIAGLDATGLVLQNNGGDSLAVDGGASEFEFATKIAQGGAYNVTVHSQPEGLTCTVGHGAGTGVNADVDDIQVICSAHTYTVGALVAGLTTSGLVLQNNGADDLVVDANATAVQFPTPIAHDGSYHVTVLTQPVGLVCTVGNGTGSHVAADVDDVQVACSAATFPVSGLVSGLSAAGLVLQNNAGDSLAVPANATAFEFATPVALGGSYSVTVQTQPTGLTCTVNDGMGSNVAAAVNTVSVTCSTATFAIGGSISGLIDSGLVLRNNGADDLSVAANATSFQFSTPVAYGGSYNATVEQQPTSMTCSITNGSGSNVAADVTDVTVVCAALTTITAISPSAGLIIGGTLVTITGTGFTGATSVTFNGLSAFSITVVNDTQLTVLTPSGAPGTVDVVVTTPAGSATLLGGYAYTL